MVQLKRALIALAAGSVLVGCATTEPFVPCVCPAPKVETVEVKVPVPVPCIDAKDVEPLPVLSVSRLKPEDAAQPGTVAQMWNLDLATLVSLSQRQRNLLIACTKASAAPAS